MIERDLKEICTTLAWISFWLVGVWVLIAIAPVLLPVLCFKAYEESPSRWL